MPTEEGIHMIGPQPLYTKSWLPEKEAVCKLIFVHGFNDHINRYYDFFPSLAARGIAVYSFDQRGWGRSVNSAAQRGLTGPTSLVISDLASFIRQHIPSPIPVFVLGHSMGGGEVLTLASDANYADITDSVRGWLLESPYIALGPESEPSSVTVLVGRLASKVLPKYKMFQPLPAENLTRDPEVVKSLNEDPLLHGTGTLEGLSGMLDRAAALKEGKRVLNKGVQSIWLGHGTADKGTSFAASKKWIGEQTQVKDKEFKVYEGWYHQLHADLPGDRPVFAKDVGDWILTRAENRDGAAFSGGEHAGRSKL